MFNRHKKNSGFTLVELVTSIVLSSILIWGMHYAIAYGIKEHNRALARQLMLAEGSVKLRYIESRIRQAISFEIEDRVHPLRSRLTLRYPSDTGNPRIVIFADRNDGSLRIHDYSTGRNNANCRLLPITKYYGSNRRQNDARYPYKLVELRFSYADTIVFKDYDNIPTDSLRMILQVDIKLADSDSNVVVLSCCQTRFNK